MPWVEKTLSSSGSAAKGDRFESAEKRGRSIRICNQGGQPEEIGISDAIVTIAHPLLSLQNLVDRAQSPRRSGTNAITSHQTNQGNRLVSSEGQRFRVSLNQVGKILQESSSVSPINNPMVTSDVDLHLLTDA